MRHARSAPLLCALACSLSLLTGCGLGSGIYSNYSAIEDLQPVQVLGVDAKGGGVLLSAVSSPAEGRAAVCLQGSAAGVVPALEAMQDALPQGQLYFAHMQYLILGQRCAEEGIEGVLDYVERDIHTRMSTGLFVVRDGTAAALLAQPEPDPAARLASVRSETARRGDSHMFDVRDVAVALNEYGAALICALRTEGQGETLTARPDGYGILKDGRLVAWLDGAAARAAGLLLGVSGVLSETVLSDGSSVTLDLSDGRAVCSVSRGAPGALPALTVRLEADAAVSAEDPRADAAPPPDALCAEVAAALRDDLLRALALSRELDADFLALGRVLRRHGIDPDALPDGWLQRIPLRVEAAVTPTHSYDTARSRGGEDGGR